MEHTIWSLIAPYSMIPYGIAVKKKQMWSMEVFQSNAVKNLLETPKVLSYKGRQEARGGVFVIVTVYWSVVVVLVGSSSSRNGNDDGGGWIGKNKYSGSINRCQQQQKPTGRRGAAAGGKATGEFWKLKYLWWESRTVGPYVVRAPSSYV